MCISVDVYAVDFRGRGLLFFLLFYGERAVGTWSRCSSVFCIMPHFSLIILPTPIWGQSWSFRRILDHYFRFMPRGISEQTRTRDIFILMEARRREEELASVRTFLTFCVRLQNVNDDSLINEYFRKSGIFFYFCGTRSFIAWQGIYNISGLNTFRLCNFSSCYVHHSSRTLLIHTLFMLLNHISMCNIYPAHPDSSTDYLFSGLLVKIYMEILTTGLCECSHMYTTSQKDTFSHWFEWESVSKPLSGIHSKSCTFCTIILKLYDYI